MVHCACVGNQEACARPELVGDEGKRMCRRAVEKGNDVFWELTVQMPLGLMDVEWRQLVAAEGKSRPPLSAET